jgi:endonuclease/exonuclease/phosphatase family metal-dependent hydrolase
MSLKLVSINIERDKHLNRVIPFLQSEKPDVLCLQEVFEKDLPLFEKLMGSQYRFSASGNHDVDGATGIEGEALFVRPRVSHWFHEQYAGPTEVCTTTDQMSVEEKNACIRRTVTGCEIQQGSSNFRIATTHFTWTPDGKADNYQRLDVRNLLHTVSPLGELVLCGDFNAPRGGEIFSFISDHYQDAIPARYKTSLDIALHRAGKERPEELADKMVDGLFLSRGYTASGVRLESGISDHCAIVGKIHVAGSRRVFNLWNLLRW